MRESMWGIFIIVIGAVGIIAINLFQRLTVTDANTYVLMKESTKAAMYDSIDIAYFRNTGNVKIIEEKFVENFTRRFAESAVINTNYKIVVHDIVEYPPKVSLSILTDLDDMKNNEYKVLQTVDSIFETVYSRDEFYGRFGVHSEVWFPGSQIWDSTPIDPVEENFCKNAKTDLDECISGDLQFSRWEELERTVLQVCDTELGKLGPKDRDAFYHECICGKWSEEKFKTINSGRPRIKDGVATYTWHFTEDGPVNDIDETITDKIIGYRPCSRDLKILIKDDLPRTNLGGIECGPDGVVVMVGQSIKLYPRYIPNNAVNRNLNWKKVSGASHLNLIPHSQLYFPYPQKDTITVLGVSKGETVVSAVPVDNPSGIKEATCLVRVLDVDPKGLFSCPPSKQIPVGSTFWPTIIKGKDFPVDYTLTYDVFNKTLASYDSSTDLITGLNPGSTHYIATVTIDGKSYSQPCPFEVTLKPDFSCPPSKQLPVGSTFRPTIIKGKDFPVDYTLTYDVDNKTLASYNSSTDLITGLNPGITHYIATVTIDGKSYSEPCPFSIIKEPIQFSCPKEEKQIYVGSTFKPTIIKGKDFPVDYTLTYDVFNKKLASYDSSTDLIKGENPGSTHYIATVTIDGKSFSELCPFEVTTVHPTCLSNPITILRSMPTAQALIVNPGNKPVSHYELFNTAYLNINSSTGLMTVLERAFSDRYLSFRVTFEDDNTYLDCPITLLGIEPRLEGDCDVGVINPLWDQVSYFMPNISEGQVKDEYETAQYNASRATISIPIQECGRIGTIEDGCRGYVSTRTLTVKGIAELGPKSYKVRFDPYYDYLNWQQASVFCPNVFTKGAIRLYSKFPSGIKTQYSPESFYKTGSYLTTDSGGAPGYFVQKWDYPSEMEKGLSGSDTITFSVQAPDGFKKPTPRCVIKDGGGKIKKLDIDTWQYTPPSPWPSDQVTVTIHCGILEDPTIDRYAKILLLKDACGKYSLQVTPDEIWSKPVEKSATATMILTNGDKVSTPENDLISVYSDSGLVEVKTNNTTHQGTIYASGAGSGIALIEGLRAQRGAVCSPYLTPAVSIKVCSTAEYYCNKETYNLLDGDRCYSKNTEPVICDSGTEGTQFLDNGNCYDKSSLKNSKLVPATCSGTNYWTPTTGSVCASKTATPKVRSCNDPYTLYEDKDICRLKRTSTKKYKYSGTDHGDLVSSAYRFSTSDEASEECKKVGLKGCSTSSETTYNCDKDPEIYGGITYCTQQPTMYCPTDGTYYIINESCYEKMEETPAYRTCEPGKFVLNNTECLPLNTPIATGVACPDPDNYAKIKQTDKFCVNLSDYEQAELKCPSSIGR